MSTDNERPQGTNTADATHLPGLEPQEANAHSGQESNSNAPLPTNDSTEIAYKAGWNDAIYAVIQECESLFSEPPDALMVELRDMLDE